MLNPDGHNSNFNLSVPINTVLTTISLVTSLKYIFCFSTFTSKSSIHTLGKVLNGTSSYLLNNDIPEAYKEGRFELWIRFEGEDSFKACDGHTYTFDRTGEGVYYLDFFMSGFDASSTPEYKVTAIADFEITE